MAVVFVSSGRATAVTATATAAYTAIADTTSDA
jgi:hypothetical protein